MLNRVPIGSINYSTNIANNKDIITNAFPNKIDSQIQHHNRESFGNSHLNEKVVQSQPSSSVRLIGDATNVATAEMEKKLLSSGKLDVSEAYTHAEHKLALDIWNIDPEIEKILKGSRQDQLTSKLQYPAVRTLVWGVLRRIDAGQYKEAQAYMKQQLAQCKPEYKNAVEAVNYVVKRLIHWEQGFKLWKESIAENLDSHLKSLKKNDSLVKLPKDKQDALYEKLSKELTKFSTELAQHLKRDIGKSARALMGIIRPSQTSISRISLIRDLSFNGSTLRPQIFSSNKPQDLLSTLRTSSDFLLEKVRGVITKYRPQLDAASNTEEKNKLDEELRKAIHQIIALPTNERTKIELNYFDLDDPPYPYEDDAIHTTIINFLLIAPLSVQWAGGILNTKNGWNKLKKLESENKLYNLTKNDSLRAEVLKVIEQTLQEIDKEFIYPRAKRPLERLKATLSTANNSQKGEASRGSEFPVISKLYQEQLEFIQSITSSKVIPSQTILITTHETNRYNKATIPITWTKRIHPSFFINIGPASNQDELTPIALAHEIVHTVERLHPSIQDQAHAFRKSYCTDNKIETDGSRYGKCSWKVGREEYASRIYKDEETEVLTVLTEELYLRPRQFCEEDPKAFCFILDVLHSVALLNVKDKLHF